MTGGRKNKLRKNPGKARKISPVSPAKSRKAAMEEALRESEERYRKLFDEAMHGIALADAQTGILLDCNQALADLVGGTKAELIGQHQSILHPRNHNHTEFSSTFKQHLADKEGQTLETQVITKTGEIKEVEVKANLIHIRGRKVLQGIFSDITQRKNAEQALEESEERFKNLFEKSAEAQLLLDHEGKVVDCNDAMLQLFTLRAKEEIQGHTPDEFAPELQPDGTPSKNMANKILAEVLANGSAQFEWAHLKHDRERTPIMNELLCTLITIQGRPFLHVAIRDITERKKAEDALREAKDYTESLIRAANVLIVVLDIKGNVVMLNEAGEKITGYQQNEVLGKNWFEIIVPKEKFPYLGQEFNKLAKQGAIPSTFENTIITKSGEERIISWKNSLLTLGGKVTGTLSFGTDITERKQIEEQLRQAMKMEAIGLLAGGVAHDFNNNLTPILGLCSMMLAQIDKGHPYYGDLEEIQKAAERCATLVRQLMAFSRKQVLQPKLISLNEVMANMEKMLRRVIGEDIALKIAPEPKPGSIKADIGQLEQIIMNLATNARDAMPQGGSLTIETRNVMVDEQMAKENIGFQPGNYVMLKVADTGTGIGRATLSHIFEPFFTTKEAGKGTGLGLSMVYGIVKQSGGNILVDTEPGKGASFEIYFPQVDEDAGEDSFPTVEVKKSLAGNETILLAEDDLAIRRIADRVLKKLGYNVISADSGEDAIKIFRQYPVEIGMLITDVVMPGISGQDLASILLQENPELKVIYISGYTGDAVASHGVIEEGTAFIQKPFSVETLALKIRQLLDR